MPPTPTRKRAVLAWSQAHPTWMMSDSFCNPAVLLNSPAPVGAVAAEPPAPPGATSRPEAPSSTSPVWLRGAPSWAAGWPFPVRLLAPSRPRLVGWGRPALREPSSAQWRQSLQLCGPPGPLPLLKRAERGQQCRAVLRKARRSDGTSADGKGAEARSAEGREGARRAGRGLTSCQVLDDLVQRVQDAGLGL